MVTYRLPQELESMHVIPAIRREYVRAMAARGLSGKEIAKMLGLTGAAVSHYLNDRRATGLKFDAKTLKEIEKSAKRIIEGSSPAGETQVVCALLRKDRMLCRISKKLGYAPRNCCACYKR